MCCIIRQELTKAQVATCRRIAKKAGYSFVYTKLPGQGWQGWFSGPNLGSPFDRRAEREIRADLEDAGLVA